MNEEQVEINANLSAFCQRVMNDAMKSNIGPWGTLYAFGMMTKIIQHIGETDKVSPEILGNVSKEDLFEMIHKGFDKTIPGIMIIK